MVAQVFDRRDEGLGQVLKADDLIDAVQVLEQLDSYFRRFVSQELEEDVEDVLVGGWLADDRAEAEDVVCEGDFDVLEGIVDKDGEAGDDLVDDVVGCEGLREAAEFRDGGGSDFAFGVGEEAGVLGEELALSELFAEVSADVYDSFGEEVSESPGLVFSILFDVGHDVGVDLEWRQLLGKSDAAFDPLHSYNVHIVFL